MAHLNLIPSEAAQILSPDLPFISATADKAVDADPDDDGDEAAGDESASASASTPFLLMGQPPRPRTPDVDEAQRREATLARMRGMAYGSKYMSVEQVRGV
jgi:hypothetical protein